MKDTSRKKHGRQESPNVGQLALAAMLDARATLYETVINAGMSVLAGMLEDDRTRLCRRRYEHHRDRRATRAGHTEGELAFGGRHIGVRRPMARSRDGEEIALPTWRHFTDARPAHAARGRADGVSTRNYEGSLEPTPAGIESGTSKIAVSRRFVSATGQTLTEMMGRDLSAICAVPVSAGRTKRTSG